MLRSNSRFSLVILGMAIAFAVVALMLLCSSAHAQTIDTTTLTFTSAEDLNRQLMEIEGCDTTREFTQAEMDSLEKKYHPTIIDYFNPTTIICREIAWVIITKDERYGWIEQRALVAWREEKP